MIDLSLHLEPVLVLRSCLHQAPVSDPLDRVRIRPEELEVVPPLRIMGLLDLEDVRRSVAIIFAGDAMRHPGARRHGWILLCGISLAALGFATWWTGRAALRGVPLALDFARRALVIPQRIGLSGREVSIDDIVDVVIHREPNAWTPTISIFTVSMFVVLKSGVSVRITPVGADNPERFVASRTALLEALGLELERPPTGEM